MERTRKGENESDREVEERVREGETEKELEERERREKHKGRQGTEKMRKGGRK